MADSPVYFAHAGGRQLGPLSFAELDALSAKGLLLPTDLVWESGTPEWLPAATLLSFAPSARSVVPPGMPEPPPRADSAAVIERAEPPPSAERPVRPRRIEARVRGGARRWLDHLASFSLSDLLPLPRLLDPETLGASRSWMLLALGLLPLMLATFVEDPLLRIRLFNLGCGALWSLFFVVAFRTEGQSLRLGAALFFSAAVAGILLLSVLNGYPPLAWLDLAMAPQRPLALRLLAAILGVGLVQELAKAAVLILLLRAFGGVRHALDGLFYGLVTGLGFGVWAAVAAGGQTGPGQGAVFALFTGPPTLGLTAFLVSSIVRMAALPFLHALWGAVGGYTVGLAWHTGESATGTRTLAPVAIGILVAATLHGLYDLLLASGHDALSLLVAGVSALLFLSHQRSAEAIRGDAGSP
ncbi:MAG: PrsW family glutamic-type intramembrane protease [Thermoanaerobaculia bacterium]